MHTLADIGYPEIMGLIIGAILVTMCLMVSVTIFVTAITGKPPPFVRGRDDENDPLKD